MKNPLCDGVHTFNTSRSRYACTPVIWGEWQCVLGSYIRPFTICCTVPSFHSLFDLLYHRTLICRNKINTIALAWHFHKNIEEISFRHFSRRFRTGKKESIGGNGGNMKISMYLFAQGVEGVQTEGRTFRRFTLRQFTTCWWGVN